MTTFDQHANFAISTVAVPSSPASSGTSLTVKSESGGVFPTPPFNVAIWAAGRLPEAVGAEIARVTAKSGDVLTIVRAQEGTVARTIQAGDQIMAAITKKTLTDIEAAATSDETAVAAERVRAETAEATNATAITTETTRAKAGEKAAREAAETASIPLSQKGAHGGVAELDAGGLLPTAQLPPLALTDPYVVASEAAQLALTVHKGDFAIRTDLNETFVQNGGASGTMADWTQILTPGDVTSVNGKTGTVNLTAANVGADASGTAATAQAAAEATAEGEIDTEETRAVAAEGEKLAKAENLKDLASAATARTNLGLGTAAVEPATAFDAAGKAATAQAAAETAATSKVKVEEERAKAAEAEAVKLTGNQTVAGIKTFSSSPLVPTPTEAAQAARKDYVDAAINGLNAHPNVEFATTGPLVANVYANGPRTLTGVGFGALTIDGETLEVGDRVLVKNEVAESHNGLYTVTTVGGVASLYVLTRATDMNESAEVAGAFVFVEEGKTLKNTGWFVASSGPFTLGTTAIPWSQFTGAGDLTAGEGITITGNSVAVSSSVVQTGAPGFSPNVIWLNTTPEYYGAKGEPGHDDSEAFEELRKALEAKGGGTARLSAKKYEAEFKTSTCVHWEGRGIGSTQIRGKVGSGNTAIVELANSTTINARFTGIQFLPQTSGQWCIYAAPTAQFSGLIVDSCEVGVLGAGKCANGIWLRGGPIKSTSPVQFIKLINTSINREEAAGSCCLKCTGQVEKVEADLLCVFDGPKNFEIGCNIELGREFLLGSTLVGEVAANATTIELTAEPAGINEKGKELRIGNGRKAELVKVESVAGKVVTLQAGLEQSHAAAGNVYLLSGTVAEPATLAPSIMDMGGSYQNADLQFLVEKCNRFHFREADMEQQNAIAHFFPGCQGLSGTYRSLITSEGESYGEATATVGSNKLTLATKEWKEGDHIAGPGIPLKATVTAVEGSVGSQTLTLSGNVEANGTESATAIPVTRGGNGESYLIRADKGTEGEFSWYETGAQDRGIIGSKEASLVGRNLSRGTALAVSRNNNAAWEKATAESLSIGRAREVVLTNATSPIKTLVALHAPGELVILRAKVSGLKIETGGNIELAGQTKVTLEKGDSIILAATDRAIRFVVVAVHRANEETEPIWTAVEEVTAKLEAAAGFSSYQFNAGKYKAKLTGVMTVKEAIPAGTTLFKLPVAARPKTVQFIVLSVELKLEAKVEINGEVKIISEGKVGNKLHLSGESYTLQV